jgi:PA14 domain
MTPLWMAFFLLASCAAPLNAQEKEAQYVFGTTVVSSSGFQGKLYRLMEDADRLPDFERLKPIGSIYTDSLNIWPQHFNVGFPGVSDRFEWFGIDYTGKIWIEEPGLYRFSLLSDDGSRLMIDGETVIDMDGQHSAVAGTGEVHLTRGAHELRVSYFQGPRDTVALVLSVAPPGTAWKILHTADFAPPKDPALWQAGRAEVKRVGFNPYASRSMDEPRRDRRRR